MQEMKRMDSLKRNRETGIELKKELKVIKDTLQAEDNPTEDEIKSEKTKTPPPTRDSQDKRPVRQDIINAYKQRQLSPRTKDSLRK